MLDAFEVEMCIDGFICSVEGLAKVNMLTGYYDNTAYEMTKRQKEDYSMTTWFDFYDTRKNARYWVEQRAVERSNMEKNFLTILDPLSEEELF